MCVQEELRQEHAQRVSAQALIEQHKQQLADLKLEASVLRQASAEHARCVNPFDLSNLWHTCSNLSYHSNISNLCALSC